MADPLVFQDLNTQRGDLERHKENSSRTAEATGRFESTGTGSIELPTRIDFGVTFVTEPNITYGSQIDVDELERVLEDYAANEGYADGTKELLIPDNGTPMMPMITGYVTDWEQDHKGFYIGAWCGVRVYYPPFVGSDGEGPVSGTFFQPEPPVVVIHHFRFSAVGMKDVPTQLTD